MGKGYRSKPRNQYSPAGRKWARRAFMQRGRKRRYLIQYEANVKGEAISDVVYVLGNSEKEALSKAQNIVKSYYPNAKNITVFVREEHFS